MAGLDPASNIADAVKQALALALQIDEQMNTQPMIDAATAGAMEAIRAKIANDAAAALAPGASPDTLKAVQEDAAT